MQQIRLSSFNCRGIAAGIYTTNSPEACQFVADDCKANVLVVENQKQLDKILQVLHGGLGIELYN